MHLLPGGRIELAPQQIELVISGPAGQIGLHVVVDHRPVSLRLRKSNADRSEQRVAIAGADDLPWY
jgi:hypothetical protein